MEKIKVAAAEHKQFLLYAIIGMSGVALDLAAFLALFNFAHIDKNVATAISTTVGITNNFLWNAFANFKTRDKLALRFVKFYGVGITGIILTMLLFKVFVDMMGINANLVKLGSLPLVLVMQYWLNRKWTFS